MALSKEEFESLLLEQLDSLYRVALRFTRNPTQAEDLVQDTAYKAVRSRDSFDLNAGGMKPWLVRILRNTFLTRIERDRRQPQAVDDATLDSNPPPPSAQPTGTDYSQYMDQELVRAMDALPEEYRTVLVLWALEDFTYQEIADALEVPIGTVMSRLHRARAKLNKELGDYAQREGITRRRE